MVYQIPKLTACLVDILGRDFCSNIQGRRFLYLLYFIIIFFCNDHLFHQALDVADLQNTFSMTKHVFMIFKMTGSMCLTYHLTSIWNVILTVYYFSNRTTSTVSTSVTATPKSPSEITGKTVEEVICLPVSYVIPLFSCGYIVYALLKNQSGDSLSTSPLEIKF